MFVKTGLNNLNNNDYHNREKKNVNLQRNSKPYELIFISFGLLRKYHFEFLALSTVYCIRVNL